MWACVHVSVYADVLVSLLHVCVCVHFLACVHVCVRVEGLLLLCVCLNGGTCALYCLCGGECSCASMRVHVCMRV